MPCFLIRESHNAPNFSEMNNFQVPQKGHYHNHCKTLLKVVLVNLGHEPVDLWSGMYEGLPNGL